MTPLLLPQPVQAELSDGQWTLDETLRFAVDARCEQARDAAETLRERLGLHTGWPLPVEDCHATEPQPGQFLMTARDAPVDLPAEGYRLEIREDRARLVAGTPEGLQRGLATVWQLLPADLAEPDAPTPSPLTLPICTIDDAPRLAWRGLHFDVARHFFGVDSVKRIIDLCWQFKLNRFHWHLTEDQGWRIEIKRYPKLTEVGAWRGVNGRTYGGFYTQEQIREVVEYARQRGIVVVPEIELPGHAVAALAAHPELSCTGGPFEVDCNWGIARDVFCAGNDEAIAFLKGVFEEVLELFDSPWIHLGADECPKDRWRDCPKCQARIRAEGLADEYALQGWFVRQIAEYLIERGRTVIGWDEVMEGSPPADSLIVEAWRSPHHGAYKSAADQGKVDPRGPAHEAVRKGYRCLHAANDANYFNYDIARLDLRTAYEFQTVPEDLTEDEQQRILGGECCLWTEFIMQSGPGSSAGGMLLPRMLAVAQRLWSGNDEPFEAFYRRVARQCDRLLRAGYYVGSALPCGREPARTD